MDQEQDIGEVSGESTEELEQRYIALKKEAEALGSGDESSDTSDDDDDMSGSEEEDDSSSEDERSEEKDDDSQDDEEMECPAKRVKMDDSSEDDEIVGEVGEDRNDNDKPDNANCNIPSSITPPKDGDSDELKRKKRIPEYRTAEFAPPLPSGWIETLHESGVPIYMHKETRVATLSRPYALSSNVSLRKHAIQLASIPCVQQRRMADHRHNSRIKLTGGENEISLPQAQLKTLTQLREETLTPDELYETAKERFSIKEIMVYKKQNWATIRAHKKAESMEKALADQTTIDLDVQNPMITVAAGCGAQGKRIKKRGCVLNIVGKTSVALLNEYVQKALKGTLELRVDEVKSSINPYSAAYYLKTHEGLLHHIGRGSGNSKNTAKLEAASAALKNLIPVIKIDEGHRVRGNVSEKESVEMFDLLQIDDPKVIELSKETGTPLPHSILQECLRMNAAWGATKPEENSVRIAHQKYELTMKVGNHEAKIVCKSLKDGRQRAAQSLLKILYPMMETWGSMLRLFSSSAGDDHAETRKVREQIVRLAPQHNAKDYAPNAEVLNALRKEMARVATLLAGRAERKRGLQRTEPMITDEVTGTRDEVNLATPRSINL